MKNFKLFGSLATQVVMTFRSFAASKKDLCVPRRRQESCTLGAVPEGFRSTTLEGKNGGERVAMIHTLAVASIQYCNICLEYCASGISTS